MGFADYMGVEKKLSVNISTLDSIHDLPVIDFIKLDTQGAELDILIGSEKTLTQVLGIECEVSFIEQYKNQPVFSDVDKFLRSNGFEFHSFLGYGSRPLKPFLDTDPRDQERQEKWLWADALFVKSVTGWPNLPDEALTKLKWIMSTLYNAYDYADYADSLIFTRRNKSHDESLSNRV